MTVSKRRTPAAAGPRATRTALGTLPAFQPVPRQCPRHDGWTPERQRGFIEALAETGSVRSAANAVNMAPEGAYQLRRHPQAGPFRQAWEAALALGVQQLEDIALERARNGVEVPVYSYGKLVGTRVVYNDRLLMFLLRHRAPARFAADGRVTARRTTLGDPTEATRLSRYKKLWRKEWDAERDAEDDPAEAEACLDRLLDKFDKNHEAYVAAMPKRTRALYDAFKAAEAEDKAAGRTSWADMPLDDEDDAYTDGDRAEAEEDLDEADRLANPEPPEDWNAHRRRAAPPQQDWPKIGPRVRRLKGEWG